MLWGIGANTGSGTGAGSGTGSGNSEELARDKDWKRIQSYIGSLSAIGLLGLFLVSLAIGFGTEILVEKIPPDASGSDCIKVGDKSYCPSTAAGASLAFAVFGTTLLIAGAAALVSGFLGFLFGIPRTLGSAERETTESDGSEATSGPAANTNLEQVSDWLTKILLGAGLTQITEFPPWLWGVSHKMMDHFAFSNDWGAVIALTVMLYYGVVGFLSGYLSTRIFLSSALVRADVFSSSIGRETQRALARAYEEKADLSTVDQEPPADLRESVAELRRVPLARLHTRDEVLTWTRAQRTGGDLAAAEKGYQRVLALSPGDPAVMREFAAMLVQTDDRPRSDALIYRAMELAGDRSRLKTKLKLDLVRSDLYDYDNDGMDRAIKAAEEMGSLDDNRQEARRQFYLACAYGQKGHRLLGQRQSSQLEDETEKAQFEELRKKALGAVRASLAKGPWYLRSMQKVWDPNFRDKPGSEDDLEPFFGVPEFEALLK